MGTVGEKSARLSKRLSNCGYITARQLVHKRHNSYIAKWHGLDNALLTHTSIQILHFVGNNDLG